MQSFDVTGFGLRLRRAGSGHDWAALHALDRELAAALQPPQRLTVPEIALLQQLYRQVLAEVGGVLQQSEQDMAQWLQQREQHLAYAMVSGLDEDGI